MKTKLMLLIFTLSFMVMAACAKEPGTEDNGAVEWTGGIEEPGDISADPILIDNPQQLAWLADQVDKKTEYADKNYKLTADLDLSAGEWPMIGSMKGGFPVYRDLRPFTGVFDGDNHTINDIKIARPGTAIGVGLFGLVGDGVKGGTVKRLKLKGGSVVGGGFVGGIVGKGMGNPNNKDERVKLYELYVGNGLTVTSKPASSIDANDKPVGGIAGSVLNGDMKYAVNNGATVTGEQWVAGVIACLHSGHLMHSFNAGTVNGVDVVGGVTAHSIKGAGGLQSAKTDNVYNSGAVIGTGNNATVGGVLAYHQLGNIDLSFNTGTVTGDAEHTGQIIGKVGKPPDNVGASTAPTVGKDNKYTGTGKAVGNTYDDSLLTGKGGAKFGADPTADSMATVLNLRFAGLWVPGTGLDVSLNPNFTYLDPADDPMD